MPGSIISSFIGTRITQSVTAAYSVGIMIYIILVMIGIANSSSHILNFLVFAGTASMALWAYRSAIAPPVLGGCGCTMGGSSDADGGGITDAPRRMREAVQSTREMLGQIDQVCQAGAGIPAIAAPCQRLQERAKPLRTLLEGL